MYRRLFAGLLVLCLLSLCACDFVPTTPTEIPEQTPQTTNTPEHTAPVSSQTPHASATQPDNPSQDPSSIVTPLPADSGAVIDVITPTPEPTPKMPDVTPLLWKVTGGAGQEVYILGSVEAADGDLYPIPTYIMDIYEKCKYLGVLTNFQAFEKDTKRQLDIADELLNPDGKTLDGVIDEDLYDTCREFLVKFKRYNSVYDYYNGAFWYKLMCDALLSGSPLNTQSSPEAWFLKRAASDKKDIVEVHTAEDYYTLLSDFSKELIEFLLAYTASTPAEDYYALLKSRYAHFLKGNQEKLMEDMAKREIDFTDEALYAEYRDGLLDVRRTELLNIIAHTLENKQPTFYVLDLDMLLGMEGLLYDLSEAGFHVELVEPTPEPMPTPTP